MTLNQNEPLELTVDKFIFRFPKDLYYSEAGLWIRYEGNRFRLGLSDFAQQRSGDIAFANLGPVGTAVGVDDEIASVETVKVNLHLPSPMKGIILEINSALQDSPEWINQDPYGKGWMLVMEPADLNWPPAGMVNAESYVKLARQEAEAELKS